MSTAAATKITPPAQGAKISIRNGELVVPDNPIIPFIEGDGTGPDIWRASVRVMDAAVKKAIIASTRRIIAAADGSKLGHTAHAYVGASALVHTLVTDATAPAEEVAALEGAGTVVKTV